MNERNPSNPSSPPPGRVKKAREWLLKHWKKVTLAGALGGAGTAGVIERNSVSQTAHVSHIPADSGKVTLSTADFLKELFARNNHVVFGDTDHTAEEIPMFIAAHVKALKEAGVEAIFLEVDREHQPNKDQVLKGKFSYQLQPTFDFINRECQKHGIEVRLMDISLQSEEAKDAAARYYECNRKWKEHGEPYAMDETHLGPHYKAFLAERDAANQQWVDLIKESGFKKTVALCGTRHTYNPHLFTPDVDEMIARDLGGGCVYANIVVAKSEHVQAWRNRTIHPLKEVPEFTIQVPKLPEEMKKQLDYQVFEYLVSNGEYETIASASPVKQAFQKMEPASYLVMRTKNDEAYIPYGKHDYGKFKEFEQNNRLEWLQDTPEGKAYQAVYSNMRRYEELLNMPGDEKPGNAQETTSGLMPLLWKGEFRTLAKMLETRDRDFKQKASQQKEPRKVYLGPPPIMESDKAKLYAAALHQEQEPALAQTIEYLEKNRYPWPTFMVRPQKGSEVMKLSNEKSLAVYYGWEKAISVTQKAIFEKDKPQAVAGLAQLKATAETVRNWPPVLEEMKRQYYHDLPGVIQTLEKQLASMKDTPNMADKIRKETKGTEKGR